MSLSVLVSSVSWYVVFGRRFRLTWGLKYGAFGLMKLGSDVSYGSLYKLGYLYSPCGFAALYRLRLGLDSLC